MNKQQTQTERKPRGVILKEAREGKQISLHTVHDMTKIPLDVLRAIEEGYTVRTLSPFYFKAFVKKYAEYLGVDISEVLDDYHPEKLPEPIEDAPRFDPVIRVDQWFTRDRQQMAIKIAGIVVALFFVFKVVGCIKTGGEKSKVRKAQAIQQAREASPATMHGGSATQGGGKVDPKPTASTAAGTVNVEPKRVNVEQPVVPAKPVTLTIKARHTAWLQVKSDGNLVFQSTLKEGTSETWEADKEIELSGKGVHDLDFEVNGKTVGALGRADRSARRVIVTPDGLAVKK